MSGLVINLPAPVPSRTCKVLVAFTEEENVDLKAYAVSKDVPLATLVHALVMAALKEVQPKEVEIGGIVAGTMSAEGSALPDWTVIRDQTAEGER